MQKVFSLEDIRTHLDLEPHAGTVQAEQKAPVYILRNSAVCVYSPVLIYDAQRAPEPSGCHCWPPTINLNHTDMASFGQEQENLSPPHPALRYMWTSATFYSLSIILSLPSSHIFKTYKWNAHCKSQGPTVCNKAIQTMCKYTEKVTLRRTLAHLENVNTVSNVSKILKTVIQSEIVSFCISVLHKQCLVWREKKNPTHFL